MAQNRGKQFEEVIKKCFLKVQGISVDRLHDQTNGYLGSSNVSDFLVYKYPYEYYIECKTVHGNTLPFSNISKNQWSGLTRKSCIPGVIAGVLCWWVERNTTKFIPIEVLNFLRSQGHKSIRFDVDTPHECKYSITTLLGRKKRVFFDYNMERFFREVSECR